MEFLLLHASFFVTTIMAVADSISETYQITDHATSYERLKHPIQNDQVADQEGDNESNMASPTKKKISKENTKPTNRPSSCLFLYQVFAFFQIEQLFLSKLNSNSFQDQVVISSPRSYDLPSLTGITFSLRIHRVPTWA